MSPPRKAFTLAEATALLPVLEGILDEIARHYDELHGSVKQLRILDVLWGRRVMEADNPDHDEFAEHGRIFQRALRRIQRLEEEIRGRGVRVPDGGLIEGLLDFPTTFEGRWIYLCWQRGEPRIEHWHEVYVGFAGRRPIRAWEAARMGIDDPDTVDDSALDF